MLEDLPKPQLLRVNPRWCCRQGGGARALRRDGGSGCGWQEGGQQAGDTGAPILPPSERRRAWPQPQETEGNSGLFLQTPCTCPA